jgi:pimeloyl-ACP methyl ester carboxylesterase
MVAGVIALIGLVGWCFVAYRATPDARRALQSNDQVAVTRFDGYWTFVGSAGSTSSVGFLFFPGSLVEPAAYAPLAQAVARHGYPVLLVELPRRGLFGGADGQEVIARAHSALQQMTNVPTWIIAGHSRGGAVACRFVKQEPVAIAGLVLVGTSHPREFSLAELKVPVMKILGTRDGLAGPAKSEQTRRNLPVSTRWVLIEGGNHSQFGCYGFQPGDRPATISRHQQQDLLIKALLEALAAGTSSQR